MGTRFAGRTVRPSAFGDAVENLCIIRARLAQYSKRVELLPHSMFGLEFGDSPRIPSRRLSDHPSKLRWRSRLLDGLIRQRLRLEENPIDGSAQEKVVEAGV